MLCTVESMNFQYRLVVGKPQRKSRAKRANAAAPNASKPQRNLRLRRCRPIRSPTAKMFAIGNAPANRISSPYPDGLSYLCASNTPKSSAGMATTAISMAIRMRGILTACLRVLVSASPKPARRRSRIIRRVRAISEPRRPDSGPVAPEKLVV
jgi:hypothetical protein